MKVGCWGPSACILVSMRVGAIILFVTAAALGALALWAAIAFGREYGIESFWLTLAWGGLFTLVPLVPAILLLRRSKKQGRGVTGLTVHQPPVTGSVSNGS
ncbi:MAG: hypothetical protein QOG21_1809 [Actinomycetota bacterium]|nr:hypothetical protein [Actinomycetota bacterium]